MYCFISWLLVSIFLRYFLFCDVTQVVEKGMRFTMRSGKHTLGYGVVTDLLKDVDMDAYAVEKKKVKQAKKKEEREKEKRGY